MQRVRGDALQRAQGTVAQGAALLLRGDHGSGRTSLLTELVASAPGARVVTAVRLDRDDPAAVLEAFAVALGRRLDALPGADDVAAALGGALLAVDDAPWLGPEVGALLASLVGRVPLVVTVAVEEPEAAALLEQLERAGAEPLDLPPLDDATADAVLLATGVGQGELAERRADAGGNLALLATGAGPVPDVVADGLAARLAAAGPAGAEVAARLHLAGGQLPLAALDPGGSDRLLAHGWAVREGERLRLVQGALGRAAAAGLSEPDLRRLHGELAEHAPPHQRARHLEAAGRRDEAVAAAHAALPEAPIEDRPALLELVRRCAGPDPERDAALARALLEAGRPAEAVEVARPAAAPAVVAAGLRQCGRVGEALGVVGTGGSPGADLAAEVAQLAAWPGVQGEGGVGAGLAGPSALLAALGGERGPSDLLAAGAAQGRAGAWDDAGRLGAAAVLGALVASGTEEAERTAEAASALLTAAPPGPWHRLVAVAGLLARYHREGSGPDWAEAASPLLDADHALPGLLAAHVALGLSDVGRSSDALALLDAAASGPRAPHGWDLELFDWARAEVELAAGRPRRARQPLDAPRRGPDRSGISRVLDHLRTSTAGWVALEVGEAPPEVAPGAPAALLAEAQGLRALHEDRPLDAVPRLDEAAGTWPSRRAALRAAWAAAEARRRAGLVDDAVAQLRALEQQADGTGQLPLLARVRSSLRRAGVRTRPTPRPPAEGDTVAGPPAAASPGEGLGLSPREHEVMRLVAEGLPSGEIAERLGVGRSTVETQVASAMRKLGARTRRQAAAIVLEQAR